MCHFSLANTKISSLLLVPMSLNTMHLGIVFFKCILFEVHGVSRSINLCTSLNLKNFSHYFFKYFCPILFLLSFWECNYICIRHFYFCYTGPWGSAFFFFLFSILNLLFFRKKISTDLSLGSLTPSSVTSDYKSTQWIFISNIFFKCRITIWFFLCF